MAFHSQNTTAVLIFARSSSEEVRHKKIASGSKLFETLTECTLKTVQKTRLPFFHITEEHQYGTTFGERFANAVQYVFNQGFESVITVGNDSPHLNRTHFETALSSLEDNKLVIGPSADGGIYLLGLHRSSFQQSDFENLSWQTSRLRDELFKLLSASRQEAFLLPTLFDIDTLRDVKIVGNYASGLCQKVLKAIRSLISYDKKIEIPSIFFVDGLYSSNPYNKGSPFLITS